MSKIKEKQVLITGGCSGIGKIMARKVLERGGSVVIWDINKQSIDKTVKELSELGSVEGFVVDISDKEQVAQAAKATEKSVGKVDILINNAGIVVGKNFAEHSIAEIDRTMQINAMGAMYVAHHFLKGMLMRNSGHICNIASSAGLVGNPNMSVYAASKWAVSGWSESVRLELRKMRSAVKVTTIMPYYINTGMFDGVRSRIPILKPESAAETIVRSIERNRKMRTLPGYLYNFTRFSQGIFSRSGFDFVAGKIFGIYNSMNDFKGRK